MKKTSLLLATVLLIAGVSGTYGYFFIFSDDEPDSPAVEIKEEQTQGTNGTVEEEPDDSLAETNDTFFRGIKDECFEHGGMERCWKLVFINMQPS